jgi:hypothetical protein
MALNTYTYKEKRLVINLFKKLKTFSDQGVDNKIDQVYRLFDSIIRRSVERYNKKVGSQLITKY